ncbi:MAG: tripartite tricarboxylate transporter substrate binding protein [Acetobacterales bacterium]
MKAIRLSVPCAALAALACVSFAGDADAQDIKYPVDTVTVVTHSSPGGGTDVYFREMIKHLGPILGVDMVVENVVGGGGAKAMAKLGTSPADGSIVYGTTPSYINTSLLSKLQYSYKDLDPLVNVFNDPQVLYVRYESPYKTLKGMIEAEKKNPGTIKLGATSPASLERQTMEQLKRKTGIKPVVVTHDGGGDLMVSTLNGTVDLAVGELQELRGQIEANKLRVLASLTEERIEQLADVPTAREQGIDLVVIKFRGVAAPKGQPENVVKAWEAAIPKVYEVPAFKKWYEASGLIPTFMPQEKYMKFMDQFVKEQQDYFIEFNIIKK